jgi:hypothetical protein
MRSLLSVLLASGLVGGCAGYAIDYVRPKTSLIAPELARYGIEGSHAQCLSDRLSAGLSVWQLRQLARSAGAVKQGATGGRLGFSDLLWVARHVGDPKIAPEVERAGAGCAINKTAAAAAPARTVERAPPQPAAPSAETPATAPAWVNLGAAPTGQSIAVDASSMAQGPSYRQAWFRITNPGDGRPTRTTYLLRIDCAARTINQMAIRRPGATGAEEQRDYGPSGEGAVPVEGGTIMEIAYLALCT